MRKWKHRKISRKVKRPWHSSQWDLDGNFCCLFSFTGKISFSQFHSTTRTEGMKLLLEPSNNCSSYAGTVSLDLVTGEAPELKDGWSWQWLSYRTGISVRTGPSMVLAGGPWRFQPWYYQWLPCKTEQVTLVLFPVDFASNNPDTCFYVYFLGFSGNEVTKLEAMEAKNLEETQGSPVVIKQGGSRAGWTSACRTQMVLVRVSSNTSLTDREEGECRSKGSAGAGVCYLKLKGSSRDCIKCHSLSRNPQTKQYEYRYSSFIQPVICTGLHAPQGVAYAPSL